MIDEITESAKAVQEVAKATNKGLELAEKTGGFFSKYIDGPFEELSGIITDKLRFIRFERLQRLRIRAKEIIAERGLENNFRVVSPKLALPIIENASLEENDELQDLWANLLASALDPNFDGTLRTAFIDILKQLEVVDVHILNFTYSMYRDSSEAANRLFESDFPIFMNTIISELNINEDVYRAAIDNLTRVRCIKSHVTSLDGGPYIICLTTFGKNFIEACLVK